MATKHDLSDWIVESLRGRNGEAHHIQIAKDIWNSHKEDLRASGDLFYTWQYDLRWAGQRLRDKGVLLPDSETRKGVWALTPGA